jgi:hypothetical protein
MVAHVNQVIFEGILQHWDAVSAMWILTRPITHNIVLPTITAVAQVPNLGRL